ncbi:O-antigen ligase family protein [Eudoraea chungangensis]|uniref:O-antigen ligase family protein n=1 Tax=Eudoraea chungangensis TaxID=1481905 RepID=UPI0023ED4A34|nr:O-antigen ligase family protein [Eudoraea chungangensis]
MNFLKYSILFLILCNIPSYSLAYFGGTLGSLTSYASSLLLIVFFFFVKDRNKPLLPFIILGLLYFLIGAINYTHLDEGNYFVKEFIRFMIVVVCGAEVIKRTTTKDIYLILLLGGLSVLINAIIFPSANANFSATYGRYSGFYLNPNFAGQICLVGYAISFSISRQAWKLIGQFVFTLAGILTFSRTFIVVWLVISLFAIIQSKKNIRVPAIGAIVIILVLAFAESMTLNKDRFSAFQSIFGSEQVKTKIISKDTRDQTWSLYYDMALDKPFIGNGYLKLSKKYQGKPGAHNSFLMIFGEAGVIPLLVMLGIYGYLLLKSFTFFKTQPEVFYITLVIVLALMTSHQYFTVFYFVFVSMFVYFRLEELSSVQNTSLNLPNNKPPTTLPN